MQAITRRLRQLEEKTVTAERPRRRLRLMVMRAGARTSLEGATCTRLLCADGSLLETVKFLQGNDGPDEPTEAEVDRWVDSCPVRVLSR